MQGPLSSRGKKEGPVASMTAVNRTNAIQRFFPSVTSPFLLLSRFSIARIVLFYFRSKVSFFFLFTFHSHSQKLSFSLNLNLMSSHANKMWELFHHFFLSSEDRITIFSFFIPLSIHLAYTLHHSSRRAPFVYPKCWVLSFLLSCFHSKGRRAREEMLACV